MKNVVNIVKNALLQNRRLSDKEMELIIEMLLNYYKITCNVSQIRLDYHDEHPNPAGYNFENKILYFNMNEINEQIFNNFYKNKTTYTFNEIFVLEQLALIFHELRHILQQSYYFDDNEIIKKVIMDCNLQRCSGQVYNKYYSLFPVEKDADVFSSEETANIMSMCEYFSGDTIMNMHQVCFDRLVNGYDFSKPKDGLLSEFYEHVVGNKEEYEYLQSLASNLSTYDKMSFNFSLEGKDLMKILFVPKAISDGFSPSVVLKKEFNYKKKA